MFGMDATLDKRLTDIVQRDGIFADSKTFVDMTLKEDPDIINEAFQKLLDKFQEKGQPPSKEAVKELLHEYFVGPGDELEDWTPADWVESPTLLNEIKDSDYRQWALELNGLWKILSKKMKTTVKENPRLHSLLYVPNPFVVPGDRFREFYYWDSYWIIGGLLSCGMVKTAKGMIENLLYILDKYGLIPNGGRTYYLTRSQPPLLIPMVDSYYQATNDTGFIRKYFSLMEKEYTFWQTQRTVSITHPQTGKIYEVAMYDGGKVDFPRPEGYAHDVKLAEGLSKEEAKDLYTNIAAECESGLDFSTRWFDWQKTVSLPKTSWDQTAKTTSIVPVDLNAYLYWCEKLLTKFASILVDNSSDDKEKAELADKKTQYENLESKRKEMITGLLWNEEEGTWFDYDVIRMEHRVAFYPTNIYPLMVGCYEESERDVVVGRVIEYIKKHDIADYQGGVPSSLVDSGQQWDFPNAWSPLVHFFIQSLSNTKHQDAESLAFKLAGQWLKSNYIGYRKSGGKMFEKYHCEEAGEPGGGGEYPNQTGFGWTNGAVLMLLQQYGQHVTSSQ